MSVNPQKFFAAQKNSFDNFLAFQSTLVQGVEKLVDLNLQVWKASLDEAAQKSEQASQLKDPQDTLAFATGIVQPSAEKALAYSKHVYDIVSGMQNDLSRMTETQIEQVRNEVTSSIEDISKNAPAGSESAVALMKSSLASANNAYESISKVAKQATEAADANINAATNTVFDAAAAASVEEPKREARARRAADSK